MADSFDQAELLEFHRRLVAGDRTAPDAFATRFLAYIVAETARKFARRYADYANDGAIDAFLDFCAHPEKFDPQGKTSMEACLLHAAWCNADNRIVSERRLKMRERRVGSVNPEISVAFDPAARKIKQEEDGKRAADIKEILAALNDRDRQFYEMQLQGAKAAEAFAKFLNIEHLSLDQQRKEVKRHKDRIRGILRRRGLLP